MAYMILMIMIVFSFCVSFDTFMKNRKEKKLQRIAAKLGDQNVDK